MDGETQVTMFVKNKADQGDKSDEDKSDHHKVDDSGRSESNEKRKSRRFKPFSR